VFLENLNFIDYPDDLFFNFTHTESQQSSSYTPKSSDSSSCNENLAEGFTFFGVGMALAGGFVGVLGGLLTFIKDTNRQRLCILLSFLVFILSIFTATSIILNTDDKELLVARLIGMSYGLLLSGIFFVYIGEYIERHHKYMADTVDKVAKGTNYIKARKIYKIFATLDFICAVAGLFFDFEEISSDKWREKVPWQLFTSIFSVGTGILSLILAGVVLIVFPGHEKDPIDGKFRKNKLGLRKEPKQLITMIFGVGSLIAAAILIEIASRIQSED